MDPSGVMNHLWNAETKGGRVQVYGIIPSVCEGHVLILLMEEILHQLTIIYQVLYIPGSCLEFRPSTIMICLFVLCRNPSFHEHFTRKYSSYPQDVWPTRGSFQGLTFWILKDPPDKSHIQKFRPFFQPNISIISLFSPKKHYQSSGISKIIHGWWV